MTYARPNPASADPGAYLRTRVMTASPEQLRLMLFDGAIRFAQQGREGLSAGHHEQAFEGISRAQAIVMELLNSLRPEHDEELCKRLSGLYTFMYSRLVSALHERSAAIVDEVLNLLQYERETWLLVMERAAAARGQQGGELDSAAYEPRAPFSVQG